MYIYCTIFEKFGQTHDLVPPIQLLKYSSSNIVNTFLFTSRCCEFDFSFKEVKRLNLRDPYILNSTLMMGREGYPQLATILRHLYMYSLSFNNISDPQRFEEYIAKEGSVEKLREFYGVDRIRFVKDTMPALYFVRQ